MTKQFCDRCGDEIKEYPRARLESTIFGEDYDDDYHRFDLCAACNMEFLAGFMKAKQKLGPHL